MARQIYNQYTSYEKALSDIPQPLVDNPYKRTYEYYEGKWVNAGAKVFKVTSLTILSPYAPKLNYQGDEERISTNVMLMGNPGSGKSGMIEDCEYITPGQKQFVQGLTYKGLQNLVDSNSGTCLLINDLKTVFNDSSNLLKTLESAIAEGRVNNKTDRKEANISNDDVRAAMIGGAVPSDVTKQIYGGFIFRIVPIVLKYDDNQESEILDNISESVGGDEEVRIDKDDISNYYDVILAMMRGSFEDYPKITGYEFNQEQADKLRNGFDVAMDKTGLNEHVNTMRQFWDGFRFTALHALLNLPNRELTNKVTDSSGNVVEADVVIEDVDATVGRARMMDTISKIDHFIPEEVKKQLEQIEDYSD